MGAGGVSLPSFDADAVRFFTEAAMTTPTKTSFLRLGFAKPAFGVPRSTLVRDVCEPELAHNSSRD